MTSVYLAAAISRKSEMRELRADLVAFGITVTSRWLDAEPEVTTGSFNAFPQLWESFGATDLEDIEEADVIAVFTGRPSTTGGYHTEMGIALGLRKRILIIGPRLNVFHCLPQVQQVTLRGLAGMLSC